MNDIHPVALFRYSVLGPLVSRADLPRGELKATLRELAAEGDREAALALYYALAETAPAESIAGFGRMAADGEL